MAGLQLIPPDRDKHREEIFDLVSRVFPHPSYDAFQVYLRNGYVDDSRYDWRTSRIGLLDGRIVTHLGVWDYQTRVGRARLRTAGLGIVATHGDYRNRGLMAQTLSGSIPAMREAGYDLSILFGIGNFYHRFGYARAWAEPYYFAQAADLPQESPDVTTFDLPPEPSLQLTRLYNRTFATTSGTAVRPFYRSGNFGGYFRRKVCAWGDSEARLRGYVVYQAEPPRLKCLESAGDAGTALRVLSQLAREHQCSEVQFVTLPYTSALARRLRQGNVRLELHYRRSGEAMVRLIRLETALQKLAAGLHERVSASTCAGWTGELLIANREESATLRFGRKGIAVHPGGRCAHAIRGGDEIAQLLLGTDDPQEIAEAGGTRLRGHARKLLPVLFPAQHPVLHVMDHF